MAKNVRSRRKIKYSSPNPLFEKWLTEWKEEAASKGLKTQYIFGKALASLRKYPLPLSTGKEAKILEFFGDKICTMLDKRLQQHALEQAPSDSLLKPATESLWNSNLTNSSSTAAPAPLLKGKQSSGTSSAVLLPLPMSDVFPSLDNEELSQSETVMSQEDSFSLLAGTFDVCLCVDFCETSTGHGKSKKQFICELKKHEVDFDVRKLSVGDFLWIARERTDQTTPPGKCRELVLDFVVERKRMDDLSHSIKDGRFREQKFRLRNCGLRRPIYLVEFHNGHRYGGIPESTLEQAIVNTQVVEGFTIKRTCDIKESVAYLSLMTKYIQNTFQTQTLKSGSRQSIQHLGSSSNTFMTFAEFNSCSTKNKCLAVGEMFAKHLLQFHGLSVDRAAALVSQFQTPTRFLETLCSCSTEDEISKKISTIKFGKYQRNLGQSLCQVLVRFYRAKEPLT